MARIGLTLDRKFRRLARALDDIQVGFGEILARGALELLWDAAYEAADEYVGDVVDVEAAAHWRGKEGVLCAALEGAGGDGIAGFIEAGGSEWWADGKPGTYRIHDLWDHAPDFVARRASREAEREAKGETLSSVRSAAGKAGRAKQLAGKRPAFGEQLIDGCPAIADPERATAGQKSPLSRGGEGRPVPEEDPLSLAREQIERDTARRLGAETRGGLPTQDELREATYPRTAALLTAVRAAGEPAAEWPKAKAQCVEAERAIGDQQLDAVTARTLGAIRDTGRVGLGWHVDAIRGNPRPKPGSARGMAPPSTEWPAETREVKL